MSSIPKPRTYLESTVMDIVNNGLVDLLEHYVRANNSDTPLDNPIEILEQYIRQHHPSASCAEKTIPVIPTDATEPVEFKFHQVKGINRIRKVDDTVAHVFGGCVPTQRDLITFVKNTLLPSGYKNITFVLAENREMIMMEGEPYVGIDVRDVMAANDVKFPSSASSNPELYVEDIEHAIATYLSEVAPQRVNCVPVGKALREVGIGLEVNLTYVRVPLTEVGCVTNSVLDDLFGAMDLFNNTASSCVVVLGAEDRGRVSHVMTLACLHYAMQGTVQWKYTSLAELREKVNKRKAVRANVEKPREDIEARRHERDKVRASKLRDKLTALTTMDEVDEFQQVQEEREVARLNRRRHEDETRKNIETMEEISAIIKIQSTFRSHQQRKTMGGEYIRVDRSGPSSPRDNLLTKEKESRYLKAGSYKITSRIMSRLIETHGAVYFNTLLTRQVQSGQKKKLKPVYKRLGPVDAMDVSSEEESWEEFSVEYIQGESPYDFAINPQHVVNQYMDKCNNRYVSDREYIVDVVQQYRGVAAVQHKAAVLMERYARTLMACSYLYLHLDSLASGDKTPPQVKTQTPPVVTPTASPGSGSIFSETFCNLAIAPEPVGIMTYTEWLRTYHPIVESWLNMLPLLMQVTVPGKVPKTFSHGPVAVMENRLLLKHEVPSPPWFIRATSTTKKSSHNFSSLLSSQNMIQKLHKKIPVYIAYDAMKTSSVIEAAKHVSADGGYELCKWISTFSDLLIHAQGEVYIATDRKRGYKGEKLSPVNTLLCASVATTDRATLEKQSREERRKAEKANKKKKQQQQSGESSDLKKKQSVAGLAGVLPSIVPTGEIVEAGASPWLGLNWPEWELRAVKELSREITLKDGVMTYYATSTSADPPVGNTFIHYKEIDVLYPEEKRLVRAKAVPQASAGGGGSISSEDKIHSARKLMMESKSSKLQAASGQPPGGNNTRDSVVRHLPSNIQPRPPSGSKDKGSGRGKILQLQQQSKDAAPLPPAPTSPMVERSTSSNAGGAPGNTRLSHTDVLSTSVVSGGLPPTVDGVLQTSTEMYTSVLGDTTIMGGTRWDYTRCPMLEESGLAFYQGIDALYYQLLKTYSPKFTDSFSALSTKNIAVVIGVSNEYGVVYPLMASIVFMIEVKSMDNFLADEVAKASDRRKLALRNMSKYPPNSGAVVVTDSIQEVTSFASSKFEELPGPLTPGRIGSGAQITAADSIVKKSGSSSDDDSDASDDDTNSNSSGKDNNVADATLTTTISSPNANTTKRMSFSSTANMLIKRPSISGDQIPIEISIKGGHPGGDALRATLSHRTQQPVFPTHPIHAVQQMMKANPDIESSVTFVDHLLDRTGLMDMVRGNITKCKNECQHATTLAHQRLWAIKSVRWTERYILLIIFHYYAYLRYSNPNFQKTFSQFVMNTEWSVNSLMNIDPWAGDQGSTSPVPDHSSFTNMNQRWRNWDVILQVG